MAQSIEEVRFALYCENAKKDNHPERVKKAMTCKKHDVEIWEWMAKEQNLELPGVAFARECDFGVMTYWLPVDSAFNAVLNLTEEQYSAVQKFATKYINKRAAIAKFYVYCKDCNPTPIHYAPAYRVFGKKMDRPRRVVGYLEFIETPEGGDELTAMDSIKAVTMYLEKQGWNTARCIEEEKLLDENEWLDYEKVRQFCEKCIRMFPPRRAVYEVKPKEPSLNLMDFVKVKTIPRGRKSKK